MARRSEHSACGVGFVASLRREPSHAILRTALTALCNVEHRGACAADGVSGDGSGIMADIPFDVFGFEPGAVAVATLFLSADRERRARALEVFTETFAFVGIEQLGIREVPVDPSVIGPIAREKLPYIVQVFLQRPAPVRTDHAFNRLLYEAKQRTRTRLKATGAWLDLFFTSLSTTTIVYKALCRASDLERFYPDLANPRFKTRFCLFHRRFSTNTRSTWDKAQPFRSIAHNGEINTIAGNRSSCYSREQALGLARDELLTHEEISDSGNMNEMVEALKYRSSIPHIDEVLSIMIPPADEPVPFYTFWGRAMEPWDGPALVAYSNGETVGARLDRNGFRPARWCMTNDLFCLASEAGAFELEASKLVAKGTLRAGSGATVDLETGEVSFVDPSRLRNNDGAVFDARLIPIDELRHQLDGDALEIAHRPPEHAWLDRLALFGPTSEEIKKVLEPMVIHGKEPIGSMGDTARPALFSELPSSFYDYFYQRFAQVTNPPLDYLREQVVTDLRTYLGVRPNILDQKELVPPAPGIVLDRPVLTLAQMQSVEALASAHLTPRRTRAAFIDCSFERSGGTDALAEALERIGQEAVQHVQHDRSILVLTHRHVDRGRALVPSLLALRAVVSVLNRFGARLHASVVLEAGDIRTTHELACAIGFGAMAVCPRLALELARTMQPKGSPASPADREDRLVHALCQGLLKIMSKMGISVVRSYHSSKLFLAYGLGPGLMQAYFHNVSSPLGGIELPHVAADVCRSHDEALAQDMAKPLPSRYRLKEKVKGDEGERHSMTAARSKLVHDLLRGRSLGRTSQEILDAYEHLGDEAAPVSPRHLLDLRPGEPVGLSEVQPAAEILARFGSGAMSFGAISAESQRDIFIAMRRIGGRCNSGEGGENPYYFVHGTCATTKQIASARFGVTAEYLVSGNEIEIKIAQGAKPGEGGQLMGVKVDEHIAQARHATPGVDLISPPPLHDIYSIEDLKELIYELKQLAPTHGVCVKLVSGDGIGTIAVGVVKAGADVIQISGGDGGTGAASLSSMRHAGLPWELGLLDVHRALVDNGLRSRVRLRVDGGLSTAKDVVIAAALGADEFGFGKLLLVAEGCIMARICEKNRCPTGIATHNPKFKAKYKGTPEHVETLLRTMAGQIREIMASLGVKTLDELIGQRRYLQPATRFEPLVEQRRIDLSPLLQPVPHRASSMPVPVSPPSRLNEKIIADCEPALTGGTRVEKSYRIKNTDRAVLAGISGALAQQSHQRRMAELDGKMPNRRVYYPPEGTIRLSFDGSAGQGFGAFLVDGIDVKLEGEANDSVCKSMCGGKVVIRPAPRASLVPEENVIIGNCALYGATGGSLFVGGRAGDRFAVRNSGAVAVIEGTGLHCCEYMTGGTIAVLGPISFNAGAGMTGGVMFLRWDQRSNVNREYVRAMDLTEADHQYLLQLLRAHAATTDSRPARKLLERPDMLGDIMCRVEPVN